VSHLVDLLYESIKGLLPCDRIGLALVESGETLVCVHARSNRKIVWGVGARAPLAGSSLEKLVRERQIRVIDDLEAYARAHPGSRTAPLIVAEGLRSNLTLPVFGGRDVVGILFFSSAHRRAYGPEHVEFLRAAAAIVGSALDRSRLGDELRKAYEGLKELDRLKSLILSNLSHELRSPLHRILAFAQSLEDGVAGPLAGRQRDFLRPIVAGAERLAELIEQLLDLSALQGGVLELESVPTAPAAIARDLALECGEAYAAAGVELRAELPADGAVVKGDPRRIAQALGALLDNGRKFTPRGGSVTVRCGRARDDIWIEVADTGIGIAEDLQHQVFQPFFQAECGLSRRFSGAGLGLAVAKAIALAHGGELAFRSVPGEGSTFRLTLPVSK
jgi:signal transduction histidine kinase